VGGDAMIDQGPGLDHRPSMTCHLMHRVCLSPASLPGPRPETAPPSSHTSEPGRRSRSVIHTSSESIDCGHARLYHIRAHCHGVVSFNRGLPENSNAILDDGRPASEKKER
jgi:hypothetical protein